MANVVDYEEFAPWKNTVEELQREVVFLRSLLTKEEWLTTRQAVSAMNVTAQTLINMRKAGRIVWRKEGKKISYQTESVRSYLTAQKIEAWAVDNRIIAASRL